MFSLFLLSFLYITDLCLCVTIMSCFHCSSCHSCISPIFVCVSLLYPVFSVLIVIPVYHRSLSFCDCYVMFSLFFLSFLYITDLCLCVTIMSCFHCSSCHSCISPIFVCVSLLYPVFSVLIVIPVYHRSLTFCDCYVMFSLFFLSFLYITDVCLCVPIISCYHCSSCHSCMSLIFVFV